MKTNVTVRILDSDYSLLCDVEEKTVLLKSAEILNNGLRDFRRDNPSLDIERLLIMGSLSTTCDLIGQLDTLATQASIANGEMKKALMEINSD